MDKFVIGLPDTYLAMNRSPNETEVSPGLPTSGQILGALVKSLKSDDHRLNSRTARRHFNDDRENIVKHSSRFEIIEGFANALAEMGIRLSAEDEEDTSRSVVTEVLDWHAVHWDRLRTFLLPRMSRTYHSHLSSVWKTYLRLAAIDVAFRIASHLSMTGRPSVTLELLKFTNVNRRGAYVNQLRKNVEISLWDFAEAVGVSTNTVDSWMYHGVRPRDEHLAKIASVLSSGTDTAVGAVMLRELRLLYWLSDIARNLAEHIGQDAVDDITLHLHKYTSQIHGFINAGSEFNFDPSSLEELAAQGSRSPLAQPLLAQLANSEDDQEWEDDLLAAGSDWIERVLRANRQVHRSEEIALIEKTDGQILKNWGISDSRAYDHYRHARKLSDAGQIDQALSALNIAIELDPLDPANHFTLASVKGDIGIRTGDAALIEEGLESCWMAVALDPNWILPWTEIGWLLLGSGRADEAVEHLRGVKPECRPLDSGYFNALGLALEQMGEYVESLDALERSLELNPNDPRIAADAAITALRLKDTLKSNKYRKLANHLGVSNELKRSFELVKSGQAEYPLVEFTMFNELRLNTLDVAIARSPDEAAAYLSRARIHFRRGDDERALPDLNAAVRLQPHYPGARVLRGIVFGYMGRYDASIADMSEAIRLEPDNATAYYYRGLAYGEKDSLDLAIADLSNAIRLDPDNGDAYRARGDSYAYKRKYDLAISDYATALRIDPENARSYRGRGAAYRVKGQLDLAIADYDVAIKIKPKDHYALRFRGDAYVARGQYDKAVPDFDAALSINDGDDLAYLGRGNARLFSGELELAIADFDAAIKCNPSNARAYHGRALIREAMHDAQGAEDDFNRARQLGYEISD